MSRVFFSILLQAVRLPLRPWLLWLVPSSLWLWGTPEDGRFPHALRFPPVLAAPSLAVAVCSGCRSPRASAERAGESPSQAHVRRGRIFFFFFWVRFWLHSAGRGLAHIRENCLPLPLLPPHSFALPIPQLLSCSPPPFSQQMSSQQQSGVPGGAAAWGLSGLGQE